MLAAPVAPQAAAARPRRAAPAATATVPQTRARRRQRQPAELRGALERAPQLALRLRHPSARDPRSQQRRKILHRRLLPVPEKLPQQFPRYSLRRRRPGHRTAAAARPDAHDSIQPRRKKSLRQQLLPPQETRHIRQKEPRGRNKEAIRPPVHAIHNEHGPNEQQQREGKRQERHGNQIVNERGKEITERLQTRNKLVLHENDDKRKRDYYRKEDIYVQVN